MDLYTLPALHDTDTGEMITDSVRIAEYLDARFPNAPNLFPFDGSRAAVELFDVWFNGTLQPSFSLLLSPKMCAELNPPSAAFYRTKERQYGGTMEEMSPEGSARRAELWDTVKDGLSTLAKMYDANGVGKDGREKPWFFGDAFSFADMILAGYLLWAKIVLGEDSEEWRALAGWDGGRWARVVKFTEKYSGTASGKPSRPNEARTRWNLWKYHNIPEISSSRIFRHPPFPKSLFQAVPACFDSV